MRDVVGDEIDGFEFDEESQNFLKAIGYLDGLQSSLYRLIAEGMPQHRPYDIVANEFAKFGKRWRSQHLLPPTAQINFKRYQTQRTLRRPPHRLHDTISIKNHRERKDELQEHFRKLADKRCESDPPLLAKTANRAGRISLHAAPGTDSEPLFSLQKSGESYFASNIAEERTCMNADEAATIIQSVYRGRMARKRFDDEGKYRDAIRGEVKLDSVAKDTTSMKYLDNKDTDKAAVTIQKSWRGSLARRRLNRQNEAATKIQKIIRGRQTRSRLANQRKIDADLHKNIELTEELAASTIQKAWRHHRPMASIDETQEMEDEAESQSETLPQRSMQLQIEERDSAAIKIQKHVRGYQTRSKVLESNRREHAAINI